MSSRDIVLWLLVFDSALWGGVVGHLSTPAVGVAVGGVVFITLLILLFLVVRMVKKEK